MSAIASVFRIAILAATVAAVGLVLLLANALLRPEL